MQQVVSTTTLNRDGTAQISFGPGASDLVLTNTDGDLGFVNNDGAAGGSAAFQLSPGDIVKPLPGGGLQWVPGLGAFASGPGAFIFGMTANSTAANPVEYQSLSADVRLKLGAEAPAIEQQTAPGSWQTVPDVSVMRGPGSIMIVDGDQLKAAIGADKFAAIGKTGDLPVAIAMQPSSLAPRDVPTDSIFARSGQTTGLYAPQGTVIDWNQPYASAPAGQVPVLQLPPPAMQGLTWTNSQPQPIIGPLNTANVDAACPRFSDVHQVAVEADARVRAANPSLSARELGTEIHKEIAREIQTWPELAVGVWSEQGIFQGVLDYSAVLPKGASRIDVLEATRNNAVCIYDAKTGATDMTPKQMLQYWREARQFQANATHIFVIPLYTKH